MTKQYIAKKAIYAGSFDPVTNGHVWLIGEASRLFDELVVAIGINPDKPCTYSLAERKEMLQATTESFSNVKIDTFENIYLVDFARQAKAEYIVRGIRSTSDYEYERNMCHINTDIHSEISTWFALAPREYAEVSSTLVKGLVGFDNWEMFVQKYVPEPVRQVMIKHYHSKCR